MDYSSLRKQVIKKYFGNMNDRQFEAVTKTEGPLLVLAGAGSGKTTVLVNRILNLVKFGAEPECEIVPFDADFDIQKGHDFLDGKINDLPSGAFSINAPKPWEILAITFTNKAAGELKERIANRLGDDESGVWAGTFHSVCGKILRSRDHAERLGYTPRFTIYDTDDQRRLMKNIMKEHNIDEKFVPHKTVLSAISSAKDKLISTAEYLSENSFDSRRKIIGELYHLYQKALKRADAMDFDDMIVNTVKLLSENEDVLDYYNNKFKYVMVDEYQDTNHAQYVLVSLLAKAHNNICVVGDDDQSIYKFRGATIENILNFEDQYKNAVTIRLEQNYRSTSNILEAANKVIENNRGRKGKTLWTDNGDGNLITVHTANDERAEARFVVDSILENIDKGDTYSENAILYRMNAQSNALENVLARSGIPYKVIGGTRFYDRKEIKDVVSYLHLINNNKDDIRLRRIINEPKRAIGETTVNYAAEIGNQLGLSIYEVLKDVDEYPVLSRAAAKIKGFCSIIDELTALSEELEISELFEKVLELTGYIRALENEGDEGVDRIENVKEFASSIAQYELENDEPSLSDFLEQLSLISDIDSFDETADRVILMTIHSAKGLEFKNVYLVGLEEGIFPGNQSIYGGPEEIEEERRLAYVAITRAKRKLYITNTASRLLFGSTTRNLPSRFLKEIPEELCDCTSSVDSYSSFGYGFNAEKPYYSPKTTVNYTAKAKNFASGFGSGFTSKPAASPSVMYTAGQQVSHKTFGVGLILKVTPMGADSMLEIAFDKVGTKKIMANYAKLEIL
ncbi:MAG: UvrD-helicase domain-containing protein [Clostridia bacterium]|nr:UvrD-helicase domain-containing protein [Clostridia bacterium]